MSSVDYFTTVLSKLAYAKNETQLLCRTLCVPTWLQRSVLGKKNPLAPRVLQCTALYSIKRRPRSNAANRSKITNKRRPRKNAAPIRRMRRLLENNKKNLSTTWLCTPSRHLRFYLSKLRETLKPLS